jgi:hypothetical protein
MQVQQALRGDLRLVWPDGIGVSLYAVSHCARANSATS